MAVSVLVLNLRAVTPKFLLISGGSSTIQSSRFCVADAASDWSYAKSTHTHTHTHTHSEWQWHQLSRMQVCTSLQTNNHASTPPLSFFAGRMPVLPPTNTVKALKAQSTFKLLKGLFIYFASAAVAVDSSHTTASSSASWSRFSLPSILLMGTCRQYGSRSVALHHHRKVTGWDHICAS